MDNAEFADSEFTSHETAEAELVATDDDAGVLDRLESDMLAVEQAIKNLDEIATSEGSKVEAIAAAVPASRFTPEPASDSVVATPGAPAATPVTTTATTSGPSF